LKKNIQVEKNILKRIMSFDVVNYDWADDTNIKKEIGLIAQDVEPYFPSLVSESPDENYDFNVKALGYSTFGVLALGAIKELKGEKDVELATLESQIYELNRQMEEKDRSLEIIESELKRVIELLEN
tara:strand:- start:10 stop:390 length:381 start_codon:yes stop_codon:yes gene_type:complete